MNPACTLTFNPEQLNALVELCSHDVGLFVNTTWWESKTERLALFVNTNDFEGPGADAEEITPNELVECWKFVQECKYDESSDWVWTVLHFGLKPWSRREENWNKLLQSFIDKRYVSIEQVNAYQEKITNK